jgi:Ca2+-binding RTX toxin-like protein
MAFDLRDQNELARLMLIACDQSYAGDALHRLDELAPYPDTPAYEHSAPYATVGSGFKVERTIEFRQTGFKAIVFKDEVNNEFIVAMAGTDGLDAVDWSINLGLGWPQWVGLTTSNSGRQAVRDALNDLTDPDSRVHFTGQSLGGALAQFAALDYYADRQSEPDILSRITLTTFNGLGGRRALELAGVNASMIASFRPSIAAHYFVTNDLISQLGGGHIGGPTYELSFRSEEVDWQTGRPLLLDPIEAHRIETGFYREFAKQVNLGDTRLFSQAVLATPPQINTDRIQRAAAQVITLAGKGFLAERSATHRNVAALIVAFSDATDPRDVEGFVMPIVRAMRASDNGTKRLIGTWLEYVGVDELKKVAGDLRAVAVRHLLTAVAIEAIAAEDPYDATRLTALVGPEILPGDLESAFFTRGTVLERLAATNTVLALLQPLDPSSQFIHSADRAILAAWGIAPEELERILFREVDWKKGLLSAVADHGARMENKAFLELSRAVQRTMMSAAQEIGRQALAQHVGQVEASGKIVEWLAQFLGEVVSSVRDVTNAVVNTSAEYLARLTSTFELGVASTYRELRQLVGAMKEGIQGLAEASGAILASASFPDASEVSAIWAGLDQRLEAAAQRIEIRIAGHPSPFDDPAYEPGTATAGAYALREPAPVYFVAFLAYDAAPGGQRVELKLTGGDADVLEVFSDGQWRGLGASGEFDVLVPEGRREQAFVLRVVPTADVDVDGSYVVEATLVDSGGAATHRTTTALVVALDADEGDSDGAPVTTNLIIGQPYGNYIEGTPANDRVIGGGAMDLLFGFGGDDDISGGSGTDYLVGDSYGATLGGGGTWDAGDDRISGGSDSDVVAGDGGADALFGDEIIEPAEALREDRPNLDVKGDWLAGGDGDDRLIGSDAWDVLAGGGGADLLVGSGGADYLMGDADHVPLDNEWLSFAGIGIAPDYVRRLNPEHRSPATSGPDTIYAGPGNDWVFAGPGEDFVDGGDGDDELYGELGGDLILGGKGRDVISAAGDRQVHLGDDGANYLDGGDGDDVLYGSGDGDVLLGGHGNDQIHAGPGGNLIDGGEGDDAIHASGGDTVYGGTGSDWIAVTGATPARLLGGEGDDLLGAGSGDDLLEGNAGNDLLFGNAGSDILDGGAGDDRYDLRIGSGIDALVDESGFDSVILTSYEYTSTDRIVTRESIDFHVDAGDVYLAYGSGSDRVRLGPDPLAVIEGIELHRYSAGGMTIERIELPSLYAPQSGTEDDDLLRGHDRIPNDLHGAGGADRLIGGRLADRLRGGFGNDTLQGGEGGDTYVFHLGDGVDTIDDSSRTGEDVVEFGPGIRPEDLSLGLGSLLVRVGNDGDALRIERFDPWDALDSGSIERYRFDDGTELTHAQLIARGFDLLGTAGDHYVSGTNATDRFGNGPGNNLFWGGPGADVYHFARGDGQDAIVDRDGDAVTIDTLELGAEIRPEDVAVTRIGDLLRLSLAGSSDRLDIEWRSDVGSGIERVRFAVPVTGEPPTAWDAAMLLAMAGDGYTGPSLLVPIPDQVVAEDTYFSLTLPSGTFDLQPAGAPYDFEFALADGNPLPAWLQHGWPFDLSGTPGQDHVGNIEIAVSVTDNTGRVATDVFTLAVTESPDAPVVANSMPDATVPDHGVFELALPQGLFFDSDPGSRLDTSASLADGSALPDWLSFDSSGWQITGVARHGLAGAYAIYLVATDEFGLTARDEFILTVVDANEAPIANDWTTGIEEDARLVLDSLALSRIATDPDGDPITIVGVGAPLGGTVEVDEHQIVTFTPFPDYVGSASFVYTISDGQIEGTGTIRIEIASTNDAPVSHPELLSPASLEEGEALQYVVPAQLFTDVDSALLAISATLADSAPLPDWLGFDPATETFAGTPTRADVETLAILLTATDDSGASASAGFELVVERAPGLTVLGGAGGDVIQGGLGDDVLGGGPGADMIAGGPGDDRLLLSTDGSWTSGYGAHNAGSPGEAGTGRIISIGGRVRVFDAFDGGPGIDTVVGTSGPDAFFLDDDFSASPAGATTRAADVERFSSGAGNDIVDLTSSTRAYGDVVLEGGHGDDVLWSNAGRDVLLGGAGADELFGGAGVDFLAGGPGNDTLIPWSGRSVIAFNRGDGRDRLLPGGGGHTISLGGGIRYEDIALERFGLNLLLHVGNGERLDLVDWYGDANKRTVQTLQVVAEAMAGEAPTNALHGHRVEWFDFTALVNAFDAARVDPTIRQWAAIDAMFAANLGGSDTAAIGGDLSYRYGMNALGTVGVGTALATVADPTFANGPQALRPPEELVRESVTLGT